MDDVRVLITMDVEPVKLDPHWTGPSDAAESEWALRDYGELAQAHGFPISLFIHPEAAELHAGLFREWDKQDACLGLHIHATKFQYPAHKFEFGYYSAEEQRRMLADAKEQWAKALGREPLYFRPGAFSANDATFPTLAEMGFRGGAVSVPGRVWPERYCIWAGAEPDPHRANERFRHVRGDLDFVDIPLSVDFETPMCVRGVRYCQDLRPTARDVSTELVLEHIVARLARVKPQVPVVHLIAHNDQPFKDPSHESCRRLETVLKRVGPLCEKHGLRAAGATVAEVVEAVLRQPVSPPPSWAQSNDVEA